MRARTHTHTQSSWLIDKIISYIYLDRIAAAQDVMQQHDLGGRKYQQEYTDLYRAPLTGDMFLTLVDKSDGNYLFQKYFVDGMDSFTMYPCKVRKYVNFQYVLLHDIPYFKMNQANIY